MPQKQIDFNIFISEKNPDYIKSWLYISISNNRLLPFPSTDEPEIALQISYLYSNLTNELKEKFKNCICLSINEWSPSYNNSVFILKQLVLLSSHVRSTNSFNAIRQIIVDSLLDFLSEDDYLRTIGFFLNTIRGFGPSDEINDFFYNIFYDDNFHYSFVPHAFLALCEYNPSSFIVHIPRLFHYLDKYSDEYSPEYIFLEFVRIVKLPLISKYFYKLNIFYQRTFIQRLCFETSSPAVFYMGIDGYYLIYKDWFMESAPRDHIALYITSDEDIYNMFMDHRLEVLNRTNGSVNSVITLMKDMRISEVDLLPT